MAARVFLRCGVRSARISAVSLGGRHLPTPLLSSAFPSPASSFVVRHSSDAASHPIERMTSLLKAKFKTDIVNVVDVSGGCGSFYQILVVSPDFEGLNTVKQHRAVNAVLEADIGKMHGLTLKTMTPAQFKEASQNS